MTFLKFLIRNLCFLGLFQSLGYAGLTDSRRAADNNDVRSHRSSITRQRKVIDVPCYHMVYQGPFNFKETSYPLHVYVSTFQKHNISIEASEEEATTLILKYATSLCLHINERRSLSSFFNDYRKFPFVFYWQHSHEQRRQTIYIARLEMEILLIRVVLETKKPEVNKEALGRLIYLLDKRETKKEH